MRRKDWHALLPLTSVHLYEMNSSLFVQPISQAYRVDGRRFYNIPLYTTQKYYSELALMELRRYLILKDVLCLVVPGLASEIVSEIFTGPALDEKYLGRIRTRIYGNRGFTEKQFSI